MPTDYYFNKKHLTESQNLIRQKFNSTKKILLYAPTYREIDTNIPLDFTKFYEKFSEEWLIFVKAHPHDQKFYQLLQKEKRVISDFKGISLQQLLPFVNCLVTDYSSIPFEYSLANPKGQIIFFCYDFETYQELVGIEDDFLQWAPGEVVQTQKQLFQAIERGKIRSFDQFNLLWNSYVNGSSNEQLIEWVEKQYEK